MTPGIVYATLAYMAWGLFPLYFRQVAHWQVTLKIGFALTA